MTPAHDRVLLTERERRDFDRLARDPAVPAAGPSPATLLAVGLIGVVAGALAVSPVVMVAGIALALTVLGRAVRSHPRGEGPGGRQQAG
ncbi:hypothetical protein I4I73_21040 [Pseudonocardia sp. KRD-184]|uniref:DUF3040 family protein n=1 Tax=Pseudonocardia oceani TaxID=2792013 RepID=A0ABS6UHT7_9PSEU|nr:hypothetical protein [Pseudonocardia oceani]MBW0090300.1 hypothetical protein [Pseudonocardia oceani]MBW0098476.1 hypothetical protein [Pseudonocardia oceani]MBW0109919.1 hypothetical protein [Pseudonocardia oceani]MBW0120362.1 hypothetical protein [Pseudonocardia oceani]MBW0131384.1 hypothetical protein [Pseudonocardia oceani]